MQWVMYSKQRMVSGAEMPFVRRMGCYFALLSLSLPPMPVKKSELFSSLWASCDELRGGKVFAQRMLTRWGSCNHRTLMVRFNTEFAKSTA